MDKVGANSKSRARLSAAEVMFGTLLHDLKQPLNLIRIVAQEIRLDHKKNRLDVEAIPETMLEIEQSIDKFSSQLDRLRIFVKKSSVDNSMCRTNINTLCETAVERVRHDYPSVQIATSFDSELPEIEVDPLVFEQQIFELLDNGAQSAVEHMRDNSPAVNITTSRQESGIEIAVDDNGKGVDKEIEKELFKPFSTTREDASGLGLALVTAGLKEVGGNVGVAKSREGGACFKIWLPSES